MKPFISGNHGSDLGDSEEKINSLYSKNISASKLNNLKSQSNSASKLQLEKDNGGHNNFEQELVSDPNLPKRKILTFGIHKGFYIYSRFFYIFLTDFL